jgi:anti-anti-sigma factor
MPFEIVEQDRHATLTLSGTVDIFDAAAVHAAVVQTATRYETGIVVSMSSVETVDGSVTQVLLALRRALVADGKSLVFDGVPPAVVACWRLAGLDTELLG